MRFVGVPVDASKNIETGSDNAVSATSSRQAGGGGGGATASSIVVAIRKRPLLDGREKDENDIVRCTGGSTVAVYETRTRLDLTPIIEPSLFSFDDVFDETSTNEEVYQQCCQPLLESVREGGGAVIFAFGQTGSGKTFTMLGKEGAPGLYGLAVTELLQMREREDTELTASFFEVYGSKLFDLLNDRSEVKMLQDEYKNIHIVGLTERRVRSVEDVHGLMMSGQQLRSIGTTHANDRSSRSHAVLEIRVVLAGGEQYGRMTFVDLAGSERASDTAESDAKTRREGAEINKSLLALKECIRAMSMRKRHIPFRGSKLTQILRESFVGRCKTCVIANISPCQSHCEDTLNTLRYADRIKELKGPVSQAFSESPTPCRNCGLPIFVGDRHVCKRQVVQCPHCREEMDKPDLETHITECKEFPLRCPHCNERMLRGELTKHNRRCFRFPMRCGTCGQQVVRNLMERHMLNDCIGAKEKCRFCGIVFARQALAAHEEICDSMKVACPFCLKSVRKKLMEGHQNVCSLNPARRKHVDPPPPITIPNAAPSSPYGANGGAVANERRPRSSVTSSSSMNVVSKEHPNRTTQSMKDAIFGGAHHAHNHVGRSPQAAPDANMDIALPMPQVLETLKFPSPHGEADEVNFHSPTAGPPNSTRVRQGSTGSGRKVNHSGRSPGVAAEDEDRNVVCPYARYGCPVKVSRLNLPAHLTESLRDHLELVTRYADRIDVQNAELRRLVVHSNNTPTQSGHQTPIGNGSLPSHPQSRKSRRQ